MKTIVLGSDHAGVLLKEQIKSYLLEEGFFILDKGCYTCESCDYPDIAELVCREINSETKGILVCGTGIGMSIKANRYDHIRCAVCTNEFMAEMTRKHNDANVIALGSRILDNDTSKQSKRLYGTRLFVKSPKILAKENNPTVILKAGVYNSEIRKDILNNIDLIGIS